MEGRLEWAFRLGPPTRKLRPGESVESDDRTGLRVLENLDIDDVVPGQGLPHDRSVDREAPAQLHASHQRRRGDRP